MNRSLQDKSFTDKAPHYAKQNLYAASLTANTYQHQPQFDRFQKELSLPFKPYEKFGKTELLERRQLVKQLANLIWSPARLKAFLA